MIPDPHSSILCAFNAGTTTVTVSAGGLSYSIPVTVQGGSVEQPCGTVPLSPSHFKASRVLRSRGAHRAATLARAGAGADRAASPTAGRARRGGESRAQARAEGGAAACDPADREVPAAGAVRGRPAAARGLVRGPIPPGGATVRVFEEKREEEAAPEQSQAFARYPASAPARAYASVGASGGSPRLATYGPPLRS